MGLGFGLHMVQCCEQELKCELKLKQALLCSICQTDFKGGGTIAATKLTAIAAAKIILLKPTMIPCPLCGRDQVKWNPVAKTGKGKLIKERVIRLLVNAGDSDSRQNELNFAIEVANITHTSILDNIDVSQLKIEIVTAMKKLKNNIPEIGRAHV